MNFEKIVITGARGFLGSHLLFQHSPEVAIGTFHQTPPGGDAYDYLHLDLENLDAFLEAISERQPQLLIHAAARANLDWCERHPQRARRIIVEAAVRLAEWCREHGCRYVFISSDTVFDGRKGNYREDDPAQPISVYGRAKLDAENGILAANPQALIIRSALIYGLPVAEGRGSSFLHWMLSRLDKGQTVPLFYDQFRTPVQVRELAGAILDLAAAGCSGVVHVGGSERLDRLTFGRYVCQIFGFDENLLVKTSMHDLSYDAPRAVDVSLRTERLQQFLGRRLSDCRTGIRKAGDRKLETGD